MIDINRWYVCNELQPKRKGKYLLMVGIRNQTSGHTDIGIIESYWNGHVWNANDLYIRYKWKYIQPGDIKKYPDFEKNNRRVNL